MCQAIRRNIQWPHLLAIVLVGFWGCAFVSQKDFEAFKKAQQEQNAQNNAEHHAMRGSIEREQTMREVEVRRVASRAACDNEKLREFLRECEEGSEVCSEKGVTNAWKFITTQPGVTLFLRPRSAAKIVPTRRGQLMSQSDPKTWLPSTRFLVLARPRSETTEHHDEAMQVGREVKDYLIEDLLSNQKNVRILGPKTLPCKMKAEELANYTGIPLPYPLKGEPQGKDVVQVWVFRTDC